ncbi:MAG: MgtC/SapB family protein [Anaerolineales bacterium]|nr:MgtC/SapB family protein [Anaerolineales bacterium]
MALANFEPWWRFAAAILIGALLGMEREFIQQKMKESHFAGIRTFSMFAMLGAVSAFLIDSMGGIVVGIAMAGMILLIMLSYRGSQERRKKEPGTTTEMAALLTFLYGVLMMTEYYTVAIVLGVITSLLLAGKKPLHRTIRKMSSEDLRVTLQFALISAVILPLLPNHTVDPWGLLNPFQLWLLVVFISGIGFSGYILMKFLDTGQAINLTGILGGLASSTATTVNFSSASKLAPALSGYYARGVILASSMMVPRIFLMIVVIYPALIMEVAAPLMVMLLVGLASVSIISQTNSNGEEHDSEIDISNPLKLGTAIKFGVIFAVVILVVEVARYFLGNSGIYLTSLVAGVTSVDAITLSVTRLAGNSSVAVHVAGTAVVIAALTNTVAKAVIAYSLGSPVLRRLVSWSLGAVLLSGAVTLGITYWLV